MNFNEKTVSRYLMKPEVYRCRFIWFMVITLVPLIFLWLLNSPPAAAQSVDEYFQLSYGSANLSQSEINGDGVFYATISGNVTCIKDVPGVVSAARITSSVVAKMVVTGALVTLNPGYTMTIVSFPSKAGKTAEINQTVPLQFPASAASGNYTVSAEVIKAEVKVIVFGWSDVTEFLPQSQPLGSIKYIAAEASPAQPSPPVAPPSSPTPEPTLPSAPVSPSETTPLPALTTPGFAWWMWLIVAIALATTIVNIALIVRYRSVRRTK